MFLSIWGSLNHKCTKKFIGFFFSPLRVNESRSYSAHLLNNLDQLTERASSSDPARTDELTFTLSGAGVLRLSQSSVSIVRSTPVQKSLRFSVFPSSCVVLNFSSNIAKWFRLIWVCSCIIMLFLIVPTNADNRRDETHKVLHIV